MRRQCARIGNADEREDGMEDRKRDGKKDRNIWKMNIPSYISLPSEEESNSNPIHYNPDHRTKHLIIPLR